MEVAKLRESQRFWQHQVLRSWRLGQQEYNALEGYGNQYWPIHSIILAWRTPFPDREAWQATVSGQFSWVAKSWTQPKQSCMHRCKNFFDCGSPAPVRVEHEEGATAWLAGTLVVPSVQEHRLPLKEEFIGPGLHLRRVHADHARPPFQWTLNSVFSAYENNNRRIRSPPDRGTLKIVYRLLIA